MHTNPSTSVSLLWLTIVCAILTAAPTVAAESESNPHLKLATSAGDMLDEANERLTKTRAQLFREIDGGLDEFERGLPVLTHDTLAGADAAFAGLRSSAVGLRGLAETVIELNSQHEQDCNERNQVVEVAIPAFRKAGDAFRKYGATEEYADLKADYEMMADTWYRLADELATERDVEQNIDEELLPYVHRTRVFCDRLVQHLDAFPTNLSGRTDEYADALRRYAVCFERLRELLRQLNEGLQDKPNEEANYRRRPGTRDTHFATVATRQTPSLFSTSNEHVNSAKPAARDSNRQTKRARRKGERKDRAQSTPQIRQCSLANNSTPTPRRVQSEPTAYSACHAIVMGADYWGVISAKSLLHVGQIVVVQRRGVGAVARVEVVSRLSTPVWGDGQLFEDGVWVFQVISGQPASGDMVVS